jgi:hypothetical protein
MERPQDSTSWIFAVLAIIAAVPIAFIVQHSQKGDTIETIVAGARTLNAQFFARDATTKSVAYRLRGVPSKLEQEDVEKLVKRVLYSKTILKFMLILSLMIPVAMERALRPWISRGPQEASPNRRTVLSGNFR